MYMDKPKTVTITFTKKNLKYNFSSSIDCPIYHALEEAGVSIIAVGFNDFAYNDMGLHNIQFTPELKHVSETLLFTNSHLLRWSRRFLLQGKSFTVRL